MTDRTLIINQAFALRQRGGLPVFTSIKTRENPYNESELDRIIDNLNKQKKVMGLTSLKSFDIQYKNMLRKTPKKIREKTDYPIDLNALERIILTPMAKGYISTAFIEFAKANSIAIYWIDDKGKVDASFLPFNYKKPSLIIKQAQARSNGKALEIAKYLIKLKVESQGINQYVRNLNNALDTARDFKEIMKIEADASNLYFKNWKFIKEWNWNGRHGRVSGKNYKAVDPINAMLNFGYALLAQRMSEILLKRGFELSIGFMHQYELNKPYWNMLAYDFIEPYRTWIDRQVMEMISGLRRYRKIT